MKEAASKAQSRAFQFITAILIAAPLFASNGPALAQSVVSHDQSPHVVGDHNTLHVQYGDRKYIKIFQGPNAEALRDTLNEAIQPIIANLQLLLAQSHVDETAVRRLIDEALRRKSESRSTRELIGEVRALRQSIRTLNKEDESREPHVAYWSANAAALALGSRGDWSGGGGLAIELMHSLNRTSRINRLHRWSTGPSLHIAIISRDEETVAPAGKVLSRYHVASYLFSVQVPLECWLNPKGIHQASIRAVPQLGAQHLNLQRGSSTTLAWGGGFAAEYRYALRTRGDYRSLRVGLEWVTAKMSRPRFGFNGLEPDNRQHEAWHQLIGVYVGALFGFRAIRPGTQ